MFHASSLSGSARAMLTDLIENRLCNRRSVNPLPWLFISRLKGKKHRQSDKAWRFFTSSDINIDIMFLYLLSDTIMTV